MKKISILLAVLLAGNAAIARSAISRNRMYVIQSMDARSMLEGTTDENVEKINFGGMCLSNGKFYFDNFELFVENDKGVLQKACHDCQSSVSYQA